MEGERHGQSSLPTELPRSTLEVELQLHPARLPHNLNFYIQPL
jgi:hypothetical protein